MSEQGARKIANVGESRFEGAVDPSPSIAPPSLSEQAKIELRRAQEARDAAAATAPYDQNGLTPPAASSSTSIQGWSTHLGDARRAATRRAGRRDDLRAPRARLLGRRALGARGGRGVTAYEAREAARSGA
jgi:hypothetical protein